MKSKTKIGLILAAIMITVVFNSGCITDAPPKEFRALYYELLSQMTEFENSLPAPTNENHDLVFAAELLTANANRGEDLLQPGGIIGVFLELDRLEELGVEGVVIAVNFPLFYPPFHTDQAEHDAYLDFYKEVAESVDSRGMTLIIENNFIFTQEGISTFNLTDFYNGLSLAEYLSGRLQTVITIADELRPDYLTIAIEPDTEEAQTGKPVNDVTIQTEYVNDVLTELENNNITDVKIGAGVGTWHPQYNAFITSFAATNIDYIDTHVYPINRDFFERVLTIADIAQSNGKSITMSETWLYKTAETELGGVTETDLFARDVFSFWAPLDQKFLEVITKLAYAKEFEFISPFWTKYFFAYLDYDEVSGKSSEELIALSSAEAAANIVAGKFTSTGLKYKELINEFSNNSPVKSIELFIEEGGNVDWHHKSNKIAFGKLGDDGYFDVWLMNSDRSNIECITCDHKDLPNKHIGNAAWYPSGEYLVIQVEKSIVPEQFDNKATPGAGMLNDLYIITKDGKRVWEIHRVNETISDDSPGVLHPHFSHDGKKLAWSERIKDNGRPFGEWAIKIADFEFIDDVPKLTNIETVQPGSISSFYETHTFSPDDSKLLFTGNQDGALDIYELDIETKTVKRLTNQPTEWDEHATYSPDGKKILWMSSKDVEFSIDPFYLQTEFWLMDADGNNKERITYFHEEGHPHNFKADENDFAVATDNSWGPNGTRVIALVITADPDSDERDSGRIVMIEFHTNSPVKSMELFIEKGGRVDWYKGNAHELIAYDTISNDILKNTEVYIVKPDGSGKQCITCNADIPKGFVGQPAWHPDGEHIIIQVENSNSKHRVMEHVSFGINNDLWIIKKDGTEAKRIWTTDLNHAALHPHFSHDGTKLIFAERIPTGVEIPGMGERTPGGENHWDGWQIRIADFDTETMEIINSTAIKPNGDGFYETNDFYNGEEFTYSFTLNGQPYVDDLYSIKIDGTNIVHIINSPTTWEEHGTYSPAGTGDFVFLSSRFDPTWTAPSSKPDTVALELFLKKTNGDIVQLTEMNKNAYSNTRYLVSDYDWDKDGERIVTQVAPVNKETGKPYSPQIWMITFKK